MKNFDFVTPVSMVITEKQFPYFKEELKGMGYNITCIPDSPWEDDINLLVNNHGYLLGDVGVIKEIEKYASNRYFIKNYNPELFLALAAMTNSDYGIVKEWYKCSINSDYFTKDKLYQIIYMNDDFIHLIDDNGEVHIWGKDIIFTESFEKPGADEIISFFSKPENNIKHTNKDDYPMMIDFPVRLLKHDVDELLSINTREWREIIADKCAYDIMLNGYVYIDVEFYRKLRVAANNTQQRLLNKVFNKFIKDDNAFIDEFDNYSLKDTSKLLFGDGYALQIGVEATESINRPDLSGKCFYISPNYKVVTHDVNDGGTIIEIKSKK